MCPFMGASAEPRNRMPMVVTTSGPISPRIEHRGQLQRAGLLMVSLSSPPGSRASRQPVAEHVHAGGNQNQRPELSEADEIEEMKIVQQQQRTESDQDDGADGPLLAPGFERIGSYRPEIPGLRRAHGLLGAVKYEAAEKNAQQGLQAVADVGRKRHD